MISLGAAPKRMTQRALGITREPIDYGTTDEVRQSHGYPRISGELGVTSGCERT